MCYVTLSLSLLLWLPRIQRRGAVIILGMLALAKRQVVADRVETLVRVGLGDRGKVNSGSVRYFIDLMFLRRTT